ILVKGYGAKIWRLTTYVKAENRMVTLLPKHCLQYQSSSIYRTDYGWICKTDFLTLSFPVESFSDNWKHSITIQPINIIRLCFTLL
ncbi:hypothetical protein AAH083_22860, partial [Bacteroides xylanisolvens]